MFCVAVTEPSLPDHAAAIPLDRKLRWWLASLAALAVLNVGLWLWLSRSASLRTPYAEAQLLLSGIYVAVCGFRSVSYTHLTAADE